MKSTSTLAAFALLSTIVALASGCVIAPRDGYHDGYHEGYYDRDQHRYYHENGWHDCVDRDEHCR
jgi:hypothetical protein